MKFTYVNIISKDCDGWLNLFFGNECIAMVDDPHVASMMREEIEEKDQTIPVCGNKEHIGWCCDKNGCYPF